MTVWPGLSIAGNAYHDDAWIDFLQNVVTQAPFFQSACAVVLDNDVYILDQSLDDFHTQLRLQVKGDGFFTSIDDLVIKANPLLALAPPTNLVTNVRTLYLEDICTMVSKEHGAHGSRKKI
ncbi:hypothetical protein D3C85_1142500 [compost metagenome]